MLNLTPRRNRYGIKNLTSLIFYTMRLRLVSRYIVETTVETMGHSFDYLVYSTKPRILNTISNQLFPIFNLLFIIH